MFKNVSDFKQFMQSQKCAKEKKTTKAYSKPYNHSLSLVFTEDINYCNACTQKHTVHTSMLKTKIEEQCYF